LQRNNKGHLRPGVLLDNRYEIRKVLGSGGQGAVYEASDCRLQRKRVAIKELYGNNPNLNKAFEREAGLLALLDHRALPQVSNYFQEDESWFLVMEFVEGKTLWDLMEIKSDNSSGKGTPLTSKLVESFAEELLNALNYLHTQREPIIHNDIKPQNIALTQNNQVKLIDFGLAKGAAGEMTVTSTLLRGYSAWYASPEQILRSKFGHWYDVANSLLKREEIERLELQKTGVQSDLYSLAATLFHCLTGEPPGISIARLLSLSKGSSDPLPLASEINPQVPLTIAGVIQKAMSIYREQRYSSASEMLNALNEAQKISDKEEKIPVPPKPRPPAILMPVVLGINITEGPFLGGTKLIISGRNFQPGSQVLFGSLIGHSAQILSPEQIAVVSPADTEAKFQDRRRKIKVFNPLNTLNYSTYQRDEKSVEVFFTFKARKPKFYWRKFFLGLNLKVYLIGFSAIAIAILFIAYQVGRPRTNLNETSTSGATSTTIPEKQANENNSASGSEAKNSNKTSNAPKNSEPKPKSIPRGQFLYPNDSETTKIFKYLSIVAARNRKPVPNAVISLSAPTKGYTINPTKTDEQGELDFEQVPCDCRVIIKVHSPGPIITNNIFLPCGDYRLMVSIGTQGIFAPTDGQLPNGSYTNAFFFQDWYTKPEISKRLQ
jgi:serine/threonine protein kinase